MESNLIPASEQPANRSNILTVTAAPTLLKIKRKRKKTAYHKVSNEKRKRLVDLVLLKHYYLRDAANILEINFSTAKTILRIFRLEKRIKKKNDFRKKANKLIFKVNKEPNKKNGNNIVRNEMSFGIEPKQFETTKGNELNQLCETMRSTISEISTQMEICARQIDCGHHLLNELYCIIETLTLKVNRAENNRLITQNGECFGGLGNNLDSFLFNRNCPSIINSVYPDFFLESLILKILKYFLFFKLRLNYNTLFAV